MVIKSSSQFRFKRRLFTTVLIIVVGIFITLTNHSSPATPVTKTKNVILMIGDGMGWEMARAGAMAKGYNYTSGKGEGLSFQTLDNYALATTYGTTIAPGNGVFSTGNSALSNSNPITGASPILPGFKFNTRE